MFNVFDVFFTRSSRSPRNTSYLLAVPQKASQTLQKIEKTKGKILKKKQFSESLGGGTLLSEESGIILVFSRFFGMVGVVSVFPELSTLNFSVKSSVLSKVVFLQCGIPS